VEMDLIKVKVMKNLNRSLMIKVLEGKTIKDRIDKIINIKVD